MHWQLLVPNSGQWIHTPKIPMKWLHNSLESKEGWHYWPKMLRNFWKMLRRKDGIDWTTRARETAVQYGSRGGLPKTQPRKAPKLRVSKDGRPGTPNWRRNYWKDWLLWAIWLLCHKEQRDATIAPSLKSARTLTLNNVGQQCLTGF